MRILARTTLILLALDGLTLSFAQTIESGDLDAQVKQRLALFNEELGLYSKNLKTGAHYALNSERVCATKIRSSWSNAAAAPTARRSQAIPTTGTPHDTCSS